MAKLLDCASDGYAFSVKSAGRALGPKSLAKAYSGPRSKPRRGVMFIESRDPEVFLFFSGAAGSGDSTCSDQMRHCAEIGHRAWIAAPLKNKKGSFGGRLAIDMAPRSSPRRVRSSWVQVPPVELGGSRRNSRPPVAAERHEGLSRAGIEPTGRNEDEPHRMSLVMLKERRRRASGVLCEGRCSQDRQSPIPANSVGVSVVSTSGRHASDKRGGPGR